MSELIYRHGNDGHRDYLDGRGVHAGELLEIKLDDGWRVGRYEIEHHRGYREPVLYLSQFIVLPLDLKCELRWPEKS